MPDWTSKKILMAEGFIILVIILATLLYYVFFRPTFAPTPLTNEPANLNQAELPNTNLNSNGPLNNSNQPLTPAGNINTNSNTAQPATPSPVANGALTSVQTLIDQKTAGETISGPQAIYYNQTDGKFYSVSPEGKINYYSDKVFNQVSKITWSPQRDKAVLEYPDNSKIVYNFTTKKQVTLPKHWQDFSFSPSGNQLVSRSIGLDPNNRFLIMSNADGTQAKTIDSIGDTEVMVDWSPNQQIVASYAKGLDYDRQKLYFIGLNNENFNSIVIPGRGLKTKWSTRGDQLLFSVYNSSSDYQPELWITSALPNTLGQNRKKISINTLADKCTFADNQTIYCAVPTQTVANSGLFPQLLKEVPDKIQKINLTNGAVTEIALPAGNFSINNLMVTGDEKNLYFTANNQAGLYQLKLK